MSPLFTAFSTSQVQVPMSLSISFNKKSEALSVKVNLLFCTLIYSGWYFGSSWKNFMYSSLFMPDCELRQMYSVPKKSIEACITDYGMDSMMLWSNSATSITSCLEEIYVVWSRKMFIKMSILRTELPSPIMKNGKVTTLLRVEPHKKL